MFGNDEWWIDLTSLTSLTTISGSLSFRYPNHITLYGICSIEKWVIDMPSLTTVTLPRAFIFKDDVSTNCEKDEMSWWLGNIGELYRFFTDKCTANECWSDTRVPLNVEVITIGTNKCNGDNERIDLSKYFNLKNVSIGNDCFYYQDVLNLTGLHSLERVMIGMNSLEEVRLWE